MDGQVCRIGQVEERLDQRDPDLLEQRIRLSISVAKAATPGETSGAGTKNGPLLESKARLKWRER